MEWDNKVVWSEGMFLRTQHFQQLDRYVEKLVRGCAGDLSPYSWGVAQMLANRELLDIGKFALSEFRGLFPDGTPFAIPEDGDHPPPLDIPENARNVLVYLTLPARQPGGVEMAERGAADVVARWEIVEFDAYDTIANSETTARIAVGKPRIRYALETEDLQGYVTVPVARIVEVRADKSVVLDNRFIPPCLDVAAAPVLAGFVSELQGLAHHRAEALSGRVSESGTRGAAEIADFLMLQVLNRCEPVLAHFMTCPTIHPERFYSFAIGMAGELCTFTAARKRPPAFPPYRHDDLQKTFTPVISELRLTLSAVLEQAATPLPLQERKYGIRVAQIPDRSLLKNSFFVLAVRADVPSDTLRRHFPNQVKIGAVEQIRDLVNSALPGIPVRPMPTAPRQIPYHAGVTYFELERNNPYWEALSNSAAIAIHVAGEFPGLGLDLWAIKT